MFRNDNASSLAYYNEFKENNEALSYYARMSSAYRQNFADNRNRNIKNVPREDYETAYDSNIREFF